MIDTSIIVLLVIVALAILIVVKAIAIVPQRMPGWSNGWASSTASCRRAPDS